MWIQHYEVIVAVCFIFISAGTQGDTDEDQFEEGDIFDFNKAKQGHFFTIGIHGLDSSTSKLPDPELLYREALLAATQLYDTQNIQINYTRVFFANVWGAEDEGVKRIVAKLNSMEAFLNQKLQILHNKLEKDEISEYERSIMPIDYTVLDMLGKSWKEVERFIDGKCLEKNLTKTHEDELHPLRYWLKFSDQELAIPYDNMKDRMEKVAAAERPRPYTTQATSTRVQPFSVH